MPHTATVSAPPPRDAAMPLLQSLVEADLEQVNAVILSQAASDVALIPTLARHLIASGGKRLRPALTLLCARLCGYTGTQHISLAACVEFIHTATLLHDDVVDESRMRRGLATANDLWGNKASVLVGDFLLSRAFQLMVATGDLKVLRILSDASAIISQGEVMQLTTTNDLDTTQEQYLRVIEAKTAALFAAACELGAVVSGQQQHEEQLRRFGEALGMAFQIMDDVLDYSARQAVLGKNVGDDFREGKITLPVIFAYAQGNDEERHFWSRTLVDLQQEEGDLDQALALLQQRGSLKQAAAIAESYCETSRNLLTAFTACEERAALLEALEFCVSRSY